MGDDKTSYDLKKAFKYLAHVFLERYDIDGIHTYILYTYGIHSIHLIFTIFQALMIETV